MKKFRFLFLKLFFIIFLLTGVSSSVFAEGNVLSGGATGRNPFLGANFGGNRWNGGFEVELDWALSDWFSLAPHLGLTGKDVFVPGCGFRFGIIKGIRPHGFWVGPGVDLFIWSDYLFVVPYGEFGWRYTFDFGLSLSAYIRLGVFLIHDTGFYGGGGIGVGYSF